MNEARASRRAPALGSLIGGRFRIEAESGKGGMASVFRATDLATQRPVAIKILRPDLVRGAEALERIRREGQVLSQLKHAGVVELETFGAHEDGSIFLVMEYLEGETLGARLRRGRMDPLELTPIVLQVCAALTAAHRMQVIHRDLKSENIFLCRTEPDAPHVKVLDFGVSKAYGNATLTQTGQVVGTPMYMPPEQLSAEKDLDERVDVYALGVVMYEALAGSPPFSANSPTDLLISIIKGNVTPFSSRRPDLPPEIGAVIAQAMARSKEARFRSAAELAQTWERVTRTSLRPLAVEKAKVTELMGSHVNPIDMAPVRARSDLAPGTFRELVASRKNHDIAPTHKRSAAQKENSPALQAPRSTRPESGDESLPSFVGSRKQIPLLAWAVLAGLFSALFVVTMLHVFSPAR